MSKITVSKIVSAVDGDLLAGNEVENFYVDEIYAGDRVSDLILNASKHTLIITHIANVSLCQILELFDIPAICLVSDNYPDEEIIENFKRKGGILIKSRYDMFETCGRIYQLLKNNKSI